MGRGTAEPAGKTFGCCMTGIVGPLGQAVEGQADWQEGDFRIIGMTVGRGQGRVHVFGDVGRNDPLYRKTAFGLFYDTATETKHVLVKPPGDARRCRVAGIGRPSGARSGRLKQFWMCLQGFAREHVGPAH